MSQPGRELYPAHGDNGSGAADRSHAPAWPLHVTDGYQRWLKPGLDGLAGGVLLLLALPLMGLVALVVWVNMGQPVIIRQRRVGHGGGIFSMYKFRTMEPDRRQRRQDFSGPERRLNHKSPEDPRMTRVGRVLRTWSLDELPQLWNVVRGEMSLVGPRPELEEVVERHYQPWQHRRHQVKPGLTGLWQISERNNGPMHEHTEVDLAYLEQISLRTDLEILLRTVPAALGYRRGF